MSHIRKILGVVIVDGTHHAIGKLENGRFAVGNIRSPAG